MMVPLLWTNVIGGIFKLSPELMERLWHALPHDLRGRLDYSLHQLETRRHGSASQTAAINKLFAGPLRPVPFLHTVESCVQSGALTRGEGSKIQEAVLYYLDSEGRYIEKERTHVS